METPPSAEEPRPKLWKPLKPVQRRILGVLVEKAKTTPDAYPLTLNAVRSGCNQKNNRDPVLNLEEEQVEDALDQLREMGAAAKVEGSGRAPKYKHYAYQWLGVNKLECAVMAELLLRGDQTEGELRQRAARMEEGLENLEALRPVLKALKDRELVISLTPEGRGHVVSHNLHDPKELEILRQKYAGHSVPEEDAPPPPPRPRPAPAAPAPVAAAPVPAASSHAPPVAPPPPAPVAAPAAIVGAIDEITGFAEELAGEVEGLKERLATLEALVQTQTAAIEALSTKLAAESASRDALEQTLARLTKELGVS